MPNQSTSMLKRAKCGRNSGLKSEYWHSIQFQQNRRGIILVDKNSSKAVKGYGRHYRRSQKMSCRKSGLLGGVFFFLGLSCSAASLPGVGNGDALCAPQMGGPTLCTVNEGQGDSLVELVVNLTNVNILINNITAGPINGLGPDFTDTITSDPIGNNPFGLMPPVPFCIGAVLAPGASCFFTQSFTTSTPGDPDDVTNIPQHGEATMFFNLIFTPQGVVVGAAPGNNGQRIGIAGQGAIPQNPDGSFTAQIQSADVKVNDITPEPSTFLLLASGIGLSLCGKLRHTPGAKKITSKLLARS